MKMKTKIFIIIFGLIIVSSSAKVGDVYAVENSPVEQEAKVVTVATVNIYDARIDFQDGNRIKLVFNLANREQAQPDVRYSVQLIKRENEDQTVVDEYIYSEVLSLGENQVIPKEIEYLAPQYLSGEFEVWLIAKNQNGLTFATVNPGKITFNGDNQYLEIDPKSCYLTVNEEDKHYMLEEGVDVKSEEKLIAHCDIINHNDSAVSFTPKFKTYWRTTFGQEVSTNQEDGDSQTLNAQEKRQFSFIIPKAQTPQAYDTVLELNKFSNKINFHYVLRGLSATIQNLRLDKDYYQKGGVAKVSFFWSASADNFPGSRLGKTDNGKMFADIKVSSLKNQTCFSLQKELDENLGVVEYESMVDVDCQNPVVSVDIKDNNGNILDKKDFSIESKSMVSQADNSQVNKKLNIKLVVIIIIALLFFISLVVIIFKRRIGLSTFFTFLILALGFLFGGISDAKADTFYATACSPIYSWDCIHGTYNVSLDKSEYWEDEVMKVSGQVVTAYCVNGNPAVYGYIYFSPTASSESFAFMGGSKGSSELLSLSVPVPNQYDSWDDKRYNYTGIFKGKIYFSQYITNTVSFGINYVVKLYPVDAICGNRAGTFSYSAKDEWLNTGLVRGMSLLEWLRMGNIYYKYCAVDTRAINAEFPLPGGSNRWFCEGGHGGRDISCTVNVILEDNAVNGSCGTRATTYPSATTAWPASSTLCSAGTASPVSPSFPAAGSSTVWSCNGINGGTSDSCTATRQSSAVNGVCGTRNTTYATSITAWPASSTLCSAGTASPTNPSFPTAGSTTSWQCIGSGGGADSSCSALIISMPASTTFEETRP